MEKNRMMRLASALLILTLLTTCMISGTFAKYTTKAEGSDTARVAKWGVTVNTHTDLFATSYTNTNDNSGTVTVKSTDANKLVAPGTKGSGLEIKNTASSEPEVSYSMTIKLDTTAEMPSLKYTPTSSGTEASYEPVKFNVYNGGSKLNTDPLTLAGLTALFNGTNVIYKYNVADGKYYVDTNLDGNLTETAVENAPTIKIEWEWAYEDAADNTLYNELDTILGNTAAAAPDAVSISSYSDGVISNINTAANLTWTVTATQID